MVRFDALLGVFAPQPPSGEADRMIATQASGSAGPLPADPLFFASTGVCSRLETSPFCGDISAAGARRAVRREDFCSFTRPM
jgi:hypothetical protein